MDMHRHTSPGRLRERPPPWPRRNHRDGPGRRPWEREREPFEDLALPEIYPGALVMDDLDAVEDDLVTIRVLARYTVARLLILSVSGTLAGSSLRTERRVALEHLALLPQHDWERRGLERLAGLCGEEPDRELLDAATTAAEAAAKRSQILGAFTLYRAAYKLAIAQQWWAEAAQVARGITQLARLEDAHYSIRLWRRRAAVLEARALRAAEADDQSGAIGPPGPADATAESDEAGDEVS
ncbi:MAG: hypothetical protein KFH98_01810 [Gemmatimonadetes bacterium]|nr:hypothetical protein [Gemmatimonadota bacterium]